MCFCKFIFAFKLQAGSTLFEDTYIAHIQYAAIKNRPIYRGFGTVRSSFDMRFRFHFVSRQSRIIITCFSCWDNAVKYRNEGNSQLAIRFKDRATRSDNLLPSYIKATIIIGLHSRRLTVLTMRPLTKICRWLIDNRLNTAHETADDCWRLSSGT